MSRRGLRTAHEHNDEHDDNHDRGLAFDVQTLMDRRRALMLFAGVGATALVGCSSQGSTSAGTTPSMSATTATAPAMATSSSATSAAATTAATCAADIPEETAGPYPGDGSNGPNVLTASGIVRSDIRSSFGSSTTRPRGCR